MKSFMKKKTKMYLAVLLLVLSFFSIVNDKNVSAAPPNETILSTSGPHVFWFRLLSARLADKELFMSTIDGGIANSAYCYEEGNPLKVGSYGVKKQYNVVDNKVISLLINGYNSNTAVSSVKFVGYGTLVAHFSGSEFVYAARYATQFALWALQQGENIDAYLNESQLVRFLGVSNPLTEAQKSAVLNASLELARYAKDKPYLSGDNAFGVNMDITVDSKTQTYSPDGTQVTIGPFKINASGVAANSVDVSIAPGGPAGQIVNKDGVPTNKFSDDDLVYVKISSSETAKSITLNFTAGSKNGYEAAVYLYNDYPLNQPFVSLFQADNSVTKSASVDIDIEKRKLYVRHVNKSGELISGLENAYQVEILPNGTSYNKSNLGAEGGYQETYRFRMKSTMNISRSTKYSLNGKKVIYSGGRKAAASTLSKASEQLKTTSDAWDSSKTSVNTKPAKNDLEDVTVVEFVYDMVETDTPTPEIHVTPKTVGFEGSVNVQGCDTTYIPSGEVIKPYIKTPKYYFNNLEFEFDADKGVYKISKLNVYKLVSGEFQNNNNPDTGIQGAIIGNQETALINGTSNSVSLNLSSDIVLNEELLNKVKKYTDIKELPTDEQINNDFGAISKSNLSNASNFASEFLVETNKYNGARQPKGVANYKEYDVISSVDKTNTLRYDTNNKKYVNVYTPVTIGTVKVTSDNVVDHSESGTTTNVIQKNANFTLEIGKAGNAQIYSNLNTSKYFTGNYNVIFGFDILLENGAVKKAGEPVEVHRNTDGSGALKAKATSSNEENEVISQLTNKILVIGSAYNMPENKLKDKVLTQEGSLTNAGIKYVNIDKPHNYPGYGQNLCDASTKLVKSHGDFATDKAYKNMSQDSYYFARGNINTVNLGRIYDFKITDCSDVNYKQVFRKSGTEGVNSLTGIQYFSGLKEFKIFTSDINTLTARENINILNTSSKKILPLGPYKNTETAYLQAPKMGYRISYDLKTSGYYKKNDSTERKIEITPSYYYISKDGKTFIDNILLYYKDSTGNYKKFQDSGYKISFKPNDGYRSIYNKDIAGNLSVMSDKLEEVDVSKKFSLTTNMMSYSNNNFIQSWYGDFKLPNSTMAVGGGKTINNPLSDGYVGVVFKIECVDFKNNTQQLRISYNTNDKKADPSTNTSQWDYESFMTFMSPGQKVDGSNSIRLQLEKGTWEISNDTLYNKIKGTVALFDIDGRAANDFD